MSKENLIENINKFKIPIALSFVGVVLIVGGIISSNISPKESKLYPKESLIQSEKQISIDVSGAVIKPGVYKLNSNLRVEDAIKASGGISNLANSEYVSKYLNLAQKLSDGMKIYVPFEGDASGGGAIAPGMVSGVNTQGQININTSSQSELEALPGIGPVTAAKVISGRPYQKIEDLLNQKIVSKSTFEKIKGSIIVF